MYSEIRNARTESLECPLKLIRRNARRVIALWLYEKTVPAARRKLYRGKGNQIEIERKKERGEGEETLFGNLKSPTGVNSLSGKNGDDIACR